MPEDDDISRGSVPIDELEVASLEIREEKQRLKWKTGVLIGGAIVVVVFYAGALSSIVYLISSSRLLTNQHAVLIGLLLTVPTLLALNFFKIIGRTSGMTPADFDDHPLVRLIREAIAAFSGR